MSNMSYCRFENTARDFDECVDVMENLISGDEKPLSRTELAAAKRLVVRAFELIQLVEETAELDLEHHNIEKQLEDAVGQINSDAEDGQ